VGIGKTALVQWFLEDVKDKRGICIQGKYDQYRQNIPYAAISSAVHEFVLSVLSMSDKELTFWKKAILDGVGNLGKVIIDLVPSLELIVGKQPELPHIEGQEAQNRLNYAFRNFIHAITMKEDHLVLFIDDMQWIDAASLSLLKALITYEKQRGLLIIGAYRECEEETSHSLARFIADLKRDDHPIQALKLKNLRRSSIRDLVADTLMETGDAEELSLILHRRTQGNPFFVKRLLNSLHDGRQIEFSPEDQRWVCDMEAIHALSITDNVVELLLSKIKTLDSNTQAILKYAACLGGRFERPMLATITAQPEEQVSKALKDALSLQLVNKEGDGYLFGHDRIQQAVYDLMDDREKESTHLQVGRRLVSAMDDDGAADFIFKVVDQLNIGIRLLTDQKERYEIAELNLKAGWKARETTAFEAMLSYMEQGMKLLAPSSWEEMYDLTLGLYQGALEARLLNARFKLVEELAGVALKNARVPMDTTRVYEILILNHFRQNRMNESIELGIQVLSMLGVKLSESPPKIINIDEYGHLPTLTEPKMYAALRILRLMFVSVVTAKQDLLPKILYTMLGVCVRYGNSSLSAYTYAIYGMYLCWNTDTIDQGVGFGRLALRMLKQYESRETRCRVLEFIYSFIQPWKESTRRIVEKLKEIIICGLEMGDIEVTSTARMSICIIRFCIGDPLETVYQEQAQYLKEIRKLQYDFHIKLAGLWSQLTLNLSGKSQNPGKLKGECFDEDVVLMEPEKEHGFTLFYFYLAKTILHYWLREFDIARTFSDKARECTKYLVGFPIITYHTFFRSLILIQTCRIANKSEQEELLKEVESNQARMKVWADHAPMNYEHHYYLVEAEKERILGHIDNSLEIYEKAIRSARENNFIHEEALGNELAAECCLEFGLAGIARHYIRNAHDLYIRWGCTIKVQDLKNRHEKLLQVYASHAQEISSLEPSVFTVEQMDLMSIIKNAHAISSERDLSTLMNKMMNIVMEYTGAEKGIVLIKQDNEWFVQATADFKTREYRVLLGMPYRPDPGNRVKKMVPESVVNMCMRTRQPVVVNDASSDSRYEKDPYIHENRIASILCIPLMHKAEMIGMLYLENNLSSGVFADVDLETLNLLSIQFSISLENSLLYRALEERFRFEKLLSSLSAAFVNIPVERFDSEITHWLRKLVDFLGVERGAVSEYRSEESALYVTHFFTSHETLTPHVSLKQFPWFWERLSKGEMIVLSSPDSLPDEAEKARRYFLKEGVRSFIAIPITVGGTFLGTIDFTSLSSQRNWSSELLQRLRLLEEIFANALDRKSKEEQLRRRTLELQETAERMKNLSEHLQEAREQERAHVAREIHDELGAALTVLKMDTSWIWKHLSEEPDMLRERIQSVLELIDSTVGTVQRLSRELRPEMLNILGLPAALEWFTGEFEGREGIQCKLRCTGDEITNEKCVLVLFRIFQEALTNVSRHAQATEVTIDLQVSRDAVTMEISDNGKGITQEEIHDRNSIGLIGMRERVSFLSGSLEIGGEPNKGTTLRVTLPLV
jgi:predicted ATPase/signal transduction histidine kinase